jgi:hypothetical protein
MWVGPWPRVVIHPPPHAFASARVIVVGVGVATGRRRIHPPGYCERGGCQGLHGCRASSHTPSTLLRGRGGCRGVVPRPGAVVHTPHAFVRARECRHGGSRVAAGRCRPHPHAFASAREYRRGRRWRPGNVIYTLHAFASVRGCWGLRRSQVSSYTSPTHLRVRGNVSEVVVVAVRWRPGIVVYTLHTFASTRESRGCAADGHHRTNSVGHG